MCMTQIFCATEAVALIPNRGTTFIELDQPVTVVLFGVNMVSWN